jgi:Flp pilus assembly pilin Flp
MTGYACKLRWSGIGRRAVTSLEYAIIAAFIAIVIVTSVAALGTTIKVPFVTIGNTLGK